MSILGELKGGAQVLAKAGIANFVLEIEKAAPDIFTLKREEAILKLQDKFKFVNDADVPKLVHDVNNLCKTIENQQLDYIDRAGNMAFKAYKTVNSPAAIRKNLEAAEERLHSVLTQAISMSEQ
jgi:hypothetical protein